VQELSELKCKKRYDSFLHCYFPYRSERDKSGKKLIKSETINHAKRAGGKFPAKKRRKRKSAGYS